MRWTLETLLCFTGTFDVILCVDINETTAGQTNSRKATLVPELKKNGTVIFNYPVYHKLIINVNKYTVASLSHGSAHFRLSEKSHLTKHISHTGFLLGSTVSDILM